MYLSSHAESSEHISQAATKSLAGNKVFVCGSMQFTLSSRGCPPVDVALLANEAQLATADPTAEPQHYPIGKEEAKDTSKDACLDEPAAHCVGPVRGLSRDGGGKEARESWLAFTGSSTPGPSDNETLQPIALGLEETLAV